MNALSRLLRPLLSVALAVLLAGCSAAAPDPEALVSGLRAGEVWSTSAAETTEPPTEWWREFENPHLNALVAEALAANPNLAETASRVLVGAARARIVGADVFPQVSGDLSGARRKQNFPGLSDVFSVPGGGTGDENSGPAVVTFNQYDLALNVSWELDVWGRLYARREAGRLEAEAAVSDLDGARLSLVAQTVKAWFLLVEARDQHALARRTAESYGASSRQVRDRYERGVRSPLDLRLALAELHGADALVERRLRAMDIAARRLEVLLGRYPGASIDVTGELPAPPGALRAGIPSTLVRRRPDLVAAEQRLVASASSLHEARASLYPRFSLTGSAGNSSGDLDQLLDGSTSIWALAAGLVQPIFQGGRLLAGVDVAKAEQQGAVARFVAAVLAAYEEVEVGLASESTLARRELSLSLAAKQSEAARTLALRRYLAGLEDYVTVLSAQRGALTAESTWIEVRRQRLESRVDLYVALGGPIPQTQRDSAAEVETAGERPRAPQEES